MRVGCADVDLRRANVSCSQVVCERECFEYNGKHYCLNCARPKIVFRDADRKAQVTDTLGYASDINALADRASLHRCRICGRQFVHEFANGSDCALCRKILSDSIAQSDENVYAKYKDLFSIGKRIFARRCKAAVEDSEVIMFRVHPVGKGRNDIYMCEKLSLLKDGYLNGPKKVWEASDRDD